MCFLVLSRDFSLKQALCALGKDLVRAESQKRYHPGVIV